MRMFNGAAEFGLWGYRGVWLVQLVKHATLNLGVMSSRPLLGVEII